jgi:RNA polymerase sigma-70 factor (ECF subfamily)
MDEPSVHLLARYREGDEQAAVEIFERYLVRLTTLARARLSSKLARKVDPEDVVQSAYRSFFRSASEGKFVLQASGHLWSLLAKITLRKVYRQVERHSAAKMNVNQEQSHVHWDGIPLEQVADEPSPYEVAAIAEMLRDVMTQLTVLQRQMLELHLQGHCVPDIAVATNRSTKTVRRLLDKVQQILEARLTSDSSAV